MHKYRNRKLQMLLVDDDEAEGERLEDTTDYELDGVELSMNSWVRSPWFD